MREKDKPKENANIEAGTVYQATLGHWHMGVWVTKEEAEASIKEFSPTATPVEEIPQDITKLPEGKYFIQPRALFTRDQARADTLKTQLGKK